MISITKIIIPYHKRYNHLAHTAIRFLQHNVEKYLAEKLWYNPYARLLWELFNHRYPFLHTPCIFIKPMLLCKLMELLEVPHGNFGGLATCHENVYAISLEKIFISHNIERRTSSITIIGALC